MVSGYQDHLFDMQCIAVSAGFWAGYYGNAKHPKPIKTILEKMYQVHTQVKQQHSGIVKPKPDIDLDAFLEREKRFKERSEQLGR